MDLQNDEFKTLNGETAQITFKLSREEKEKLVAESAELGITLSEFIRIKAISTESDLIALRNRVAALRKEILILKTKLSFYKDTVRDDNSIILQLTEEQRRILLIFAKGFSIKKSPGEQIVEAFVHLCTLDQIWNFMIEWHHVKLDEIREAFEDEY